MIGYIKGTIEEIGTDCMYLDRDGIGFRILVPANCLDRVHIGDRLKIFTYMNVKEDAITLFGFLTRDDLNIFKLLLGVNGVGPKAALGILSALTPDTLRFAVLSDDAAAIAKAPGIGKKTAQKLILELKDKFSLEEAFEKKLAATEMAAVDGGSGSGADKEAESDAVQALVALGYSATEALQAVKKVGADGSMDSEAILKQALKYIF
ncbi:MAG: Holliday junction branch migration protein RuvA [Lachnospiraceae bacterium]|nr:Holliday junction branch migration protein RuvA [Lachnospiraceae bacterium]